MSKNLSRAIDRLVDRIDALVLLRAGLTDRRPLQDGEVPCIDLTDALCVKIIGG
jgi:hypothetical protein